MDQRTPRPSHNGAGRAVLARSPNGNRNGRRHLAPAAPTLARGAECLSLANSCSVLDNQSPDRKSARSPAIGRQMLHTTDSRTPAGRRHLAFVQRTTPTQEVEHRQQCNFLDGTLSHQPLQLGQTTLSGESRHMTLAGWAAQCSTRAAEPPTGKSPARFGNGLDARPQCFL